ncbi:tenascin-like [Eupeodes corollae]|uniref:tenascin-like n=1 Tax=Eupeodes corollae TaxID=290404 RepID=UPI00249368D0|nr:tenascin-like [Eupeodes corollae]
MNHIKFILISVVWLNILPSFSSANWCIQETTSNMRVTKAKTKIITSRKWFGGIKRKTVSYTVTELVPRIRQRRVCCEGYTLDRLQNICEPNCPNGCPRLSECVRPNYCECQKGYQMKGYRCEPICEPNCDFCISPNTCLYEPTKSFDQTVTEDITTQDDIEHLVQTANPTTFGIVEMQSTTPSEPETLGTTPEPLSTEITDLTTSTSCPFPTERTWTDKMRRTTLHYRERNAFCFYEYQCLTGLGKLLLVIKNCQCNDGYVHAWSDCHRDLGFEASECVKESLCTSATTEQYQISTDQERIASEAPETTIFTSTDIFSNSCEEECLNGLCVNGLCQCPKGSVYSVGLKSCIDSSSCDTICHNGTCQEDGFCECQKGFIYQYSQGCVPDDDDDDNCDKKCINGFCESSSGKCKCRDGFSHSPENVYECVASVGTGTGKLERHNHSEEGFPWIWVVSTIFIIAILGFFVIKRARKHNYNVDKVEKNRHIVHFDSRDV